MQKKLTITVDEAIYDGLYQVVGKRRISQFISDLVKPYLEHPALEAAYLEMAQDEEAEAEALEWCEAMIGDVTDETR